MLHICHLGTVKCFCKHTGYAIVFLTDYRIALKITNTFEALEFKLRRYNATQLAHKDSPIPFIAAFIISKIFDRILKVFWCRFRSNRRAANSRCVSDFYSR
jgi:hypothetical protein